MLMVVSPAKSLDMDMPAPVASFTQPEFLDEAMTLVTQLRSLSEAELVALMDISGKLARLNAQRYADFSPPFSQDNAKQAVFAFNGDVYDGLGAASLSLPALDYLQGHLRILSGLYGLLRPLDLMQPYRLEMGTRLANVRGKDLYAFWGERLTRRLAEVLVQDDQSVLVNLASEEYFSAVQPDALGARVVTPVFQDEKAGKYKIISFYAKKARGMMVRYASERQVRDVEELKAFEVAGYAYAPEVSTEDRWVFRRSEALG